MIERVFLRESIYVDSPVKLYCILSEKDWDKYQNENIACVYKIFHRPKCIQPTLGF